MSGLGGGGAAVLTYYRAMVETDPLPARRAMMSRLVELTRTLILTLALTLALAAR